MTYLFYIPTTNYILEGYEDKKIKKLKAKYRYDSPIFNLYFKMVKYSQNSGKNVKIGDKIYL
jgi:ABC-type microcin C transport system permease subunit YejB